MSTPEIVDAKPGRTRFRPAAAKRTKVPGLGGVPQVSLLPAEVRDAGDAARHRRRLVVVVAIAAVLAGASVAAAGGVESAAQARAAGATQQSTILNQQLGKFDDVRALERNVSVGRAAVKVGGATIIDWSSQIRAMEADKPAGYTVIGIDASGASPLTEYAQGATVLEPRRAATVIMTLSSASVGDEFSVWLRRLRSIPAYGDVSGSTQADSTGGSTITITMHLSPAAITGATESK